MMRVLVVGASGLIGSYVVSRLLQDRHEIVGAGRDVAAAERRQPLVRWVRLDLATTRRDRWRELLADVDAVVNCAGALQASPRDDLRAVHLDGLLELATACDAVGVRRFVQISAAGVETGRGEFSRTKLEAESALIRLDLDWVILRPGLVLAPAAFGGSALLRGLAGFPFVIPAVYSESVVQVVSIDDVAEAVSRCVLPDGPSKIVCELAARSPTRLADVLIALRAWLGIEPARVLALPAGLGHVAALVADGLAWLGWQSPMRSAAIEQLANGVRARSDDAPHLLGFAPRELGDILFRWPSGVQERWFVRLYFIKPLVLATLASFWVISGVIGLLRQGAASAVLTEAGVPEALAHSLVFAGAVADVAIGLLICAPRTAPFALGASMIVTAVYLAGATGLRPELWVDPLGPLIKAVPVVLLAIVGLALMDDR